MQPDSTDRKDVNKEEFWINQFKIVSIISTFIAMINENKKEVSKYE